MCDVIIISTNKCSVINLQVSQRPWLTKGTLAYTYLPSPPLDVYFQCVFSEIIWVVAGQYFPTYSSHGPYLLLLWTIQLILMSRIAESINKGSLCGENKESV